VVVGLVDQAFGLFDSSFTVDWLHAESVQKMLIALVTNCGIGYPTPKRLSPRFRRESLSPSRLSVFLFHLGIRAM
jgi:hypothetical protein